MELIYFFADTDQKEKAENAIARAQKSLVPEQADLVAAIGADLIGQDRQAEERFGTLLTRRPNDPQVLRQAASFFTRHGQLARADETLRTLILQGTPADAAAAALNRRSSWPFKMTRRSSERPTISLKKPARKNGKRVTTVSSRPRFWPGNRVAAERR